MLYGSEFLDKDPVFREQTKKSHFKTDTRALTTNENS